jgi:hypothetical protein
MRKQGQRVGRGHPWQPWPTLGLERDPQVYYPKGLPRCRSLVLHSAIDSDRDRCTAVDDFGIRCQLQPHLDDEHCAMVPFDVVGARGKRRLAGSGTSTFGTKPPTGSLGQATVGGLI